MPTHAQIVWREGLGVVHQRERFASALVRPLVWLFNLRRWLSASARRVNHPSYETYILKEFYIPPGLMLLAQPQFASQEPVERQPAAMSLTR
jgi:ABC-2 type transport system permease protein